MLVCIIPSLQGPAADQPLYKGQHSQMTSQEKDRALLERTAEVRELNRKLRARDRAAEMHEKEAVPVDGDLGAILHKWTQVGGEMDHSIKAGAEKEYPGLFRKGRDLLVSIC